jgi:DNA (cytosine-5)-methyltransferase 1
MESVEGQTEGSTQQRQRTRRESDTGSVDNEWGKYGTAIRRWKLIVNKAAPAPTVAGTDKRRLNPRFVEWMMGLPDGWVTGHGLSAAKELKMLGNGVVPQQAHAAITQLLERTQQ